MLKFQYFSMETSLVLIFCQIRLLLNRRQLTVTDREVQDVKPEGKNRCRNTPSAMIASPK